MSTSVIEKKEKIVLPTNKRYFVYFLACFIFFVLWMDEVAFATLSPFWSKDLGFTAAEVALISSAYFLGYFPTLFVGGLVGDLIGVKRTLMISILGCALTSIAMLATKSFEAMYWRNLIFGVFLGFFMAPTNVLIASWAPSKEVTTVASAWGIMSSLATIAGIPLVLMLATRSNWKIAFIFVTIFSLIAFLLLLKTTNDPAQSKNISPEELAYIKEGKLEKDESKPKEKFNLKGFLEIFKDYRVWFMLVAVTFAIGPSYVSSIWASMFLINGVGLSADSTAGFGSMFSIIPVLGVFLAAVMQKVYKGSLKLLIATGAALGALSYWLIVLFPIPPVAYALLIYGISFMCNPFGWGPVNAYWQATIKPQYLSTMNGLGGAAVTALGYYLIKMSGTWIVDSNSLSGWMPLFRNTAILWLIAIVAVIFIKNIKVKY